MLKGSGPSRASVGTSFNSGCGWANVPGGSGNNGVAAPAAPSASNYAIPGGATVVSSSAGLLNALAATTAQDIKILNGSYTNTSGVTPAAAHRLWGESPAGVVLNFGLSFGTRSGWSVAGLTINCADTTHAGSGSGLSACIATSQGSGTGWTVTDCYLTGAHVVSTGLLGYSPNGMTAQRLDVQNFTDYGLRLSDNTVTSSAVITTITDLNIAGIYRASRGSSNGTAEAGLWIGHNVANVVDKVKIRDCGWMGGWTGNAAFGFTLNNIDIDQIIGVDEVGWYFEHLSRNITLQNFSIGPTLSTGINSEWDYGQVAGLSGSHTFPTSTITMNENSIHMANSGTGYIGNPGGTIISFTYTGRSGSTLSGVSGGSGTFPSGTLVTLPGDLATPQLGGGFASWGLVIQDGTVGTSRGSYPIFFDNGSMNPTVQRVTFSQASTSSAIHDRSNNPQCTSVANSLLTTTGNTYNGLTAVSYG